VGAVVGADSLSAHAAVLERAHAARLAELDDEREINRKLERAEVLCPAQEHRDILDADEEAREEQLRHEDGWRELHRHLSQPAAAQGVPLSVEGAVVS
jgi:hypothetical protein